MRTRTTLACVALLAMALAGCSDELRYPEPIEDGSDSATGTGSGTSSPTGTTTNSASDTSTGPLGNETNRAPLAGLTVATNGTNATFSLTGTDPDGDNLTWELDYGDGNATNGTSLPLTVNHTYAMTGNFSANLTVSDGMREGHAQIVVQFGNGSTEKVVLTGETTLPSSPLTSGALGANGCAGFNAGVSGQDCVIFELGPELAGRPFLAEGTGVNLDVDIWSSCDPAPPSSLQTGSVEGTIPAGAACMILWFYSAGSTGTVTVTIG